MVAYLLGCLFVSQQQINQIRRLYSNLRTPDLVITLWTRKAVMELIEQETGIRMPIRTVGEYLKRWGFTPPEARETSL